MTSEVIFEGKSKKNREIAIRFPKCTDVESLWRYINALSQEKTHIRFQGETISLEEEKEYLTSLLQEIDQRKALHLLAFHQNELIGVAGIDMVDRTSRHVGELGISIHKNFRGEGIGTLLMEMVIQEAVKTIPLLEIITLEVFSNNLIGTEMYKKQGFIPYGCLPRGIKLENRYEDLVLMSKTVLNKKNMI